MRASLRVNLPWIRILMIVERGGAINCATRQHVNRPRSSATVTYFIKARESREFCFERLSSRQAHQYADLMAVYPVSADPSGGESVVCCRRQSQLDVAAHEQPRQPPRRFRLLVDSKGIILAARPIRPA